MAVATHSAMSSIAQRTQKVSVAKFISEHLRDSRRRVRETGALEAPVPGVQVSAVLGVGHKSVVSVRRSEPLTMLFSRSSRLQSGFVLRGLAAAASPPNAVPSCAYPLRSERDGPSG
jgi:hypothetical protein